MKKENFIFVILLMLTVNVCVGQTLRLIDLMKQTGYMDIQIGMSVKELQEKHLEIQLINSDGSLYGVTYWGCEKCPQFLDLPIEANYYYIDYHKKIASVSWILKEADKTKALKSKLYNLFGTSVKIDSTSKSNIIELKTDSFSLSFNTPVGSDRQFVILKSSLVPPQELDPSEFYGNQLEKYKKDQINKRGKGNGSFNLSLSKIESVLNNHTTVATLKKILPEWSSDEIYSDNLLFLYDEKTGRHSVPEFFIPFIITIGNKKYKLVVKIKNSLHAEIKAISFNPIYYTVGSEMDLYDYEKSLLAHGYYPGKAYKRNEKYYHKKNLTFYASVYSETLTVEIGHF